VTAVPGRQHHRLGGGPGMGRHARRQCHHCPVGTHRHRCSLPTASTRRRARPDRGGPRRRSRRRRAASQRRRLLDPRTRTRTRTILARNLAAVIDQSQLAGDCWDAGSLR
jgi:hypothetical protein